LKKIFEPVHFLQMRPENFPGIRLSQLASLFSSATGLFTWILSCSYLPELRKKLIVTANDYWHQHYVFEKKSVFREKMLGSDMCNNIIINSIIPLLYTYGKIIPDPASLKKAISWLEQIPVEHNHCMQGWNRMGITVKRAAGSQALTELKNNFVTSADAWNVKSEGNCYIPFRPGILFKAKVPERSASCNSPSHQYPDVC